MSCTTGRPKGPGIRVAALLTFAVAASSWAMEPPTREQRERYRADGSLAARAAAARAYGNHLLAPELAARLDPEAAEAAKAEDAAKRLPSTGTQRVLALLLSFSDAPGHNDPESIHTQLFGDGLAENYPKESLRNFYRRSSHGLLEIEGDTLGWYQTDYPRSAVPETTTGREALIQEALAHFDAEGHDFSQYDNDGDGVVDYFLIFWSGRHQDWAEFWWGYQTSFRDRSFTLDGVRFGTYSWQWEAYNYPGAFSPEVSIHETGHALGLPDYYDYDDTVGPSGGVGGLDQMDANWGDHNCFSKWVLGWLTPESYNSGTTLVSLAAADEAAEAVVLMHGNLQEDPYGEYFMVEHRRRQGNDSTYPADGLLIWHVDARRDERGRFLYDNSYAEHKLLRLMEADGLEQIENNGSANAGDFYQPGDVFGTDTVPSSHRYDGAPTNLLIDDIAEEDDHIGLRSDLGSGCALFCEAQAASTAWPGLDTTFNGSTSSENCSNAAPMLWTLGDGTEGSSTTVTHSFKEEDSYSWQLSSTLGDAFCARGGEILVCRDLRCWQWEEMAAMNEARGRHQAVRLDDGRVLIVGGLATPQIFDPASRSWSETGAIPVTLVDPRAVLLQDGRVLIVGFSTTGISDTVLYEVSSDSWKTASRLNHGRLSHSILALADGRVLVAGGAAFNEEMQRVDELTVELFDPDTADWTVVGELPEAMDDPGLNQLGDGRLFVSANRSGWLLEPASWSWSEAQTLVFERFDHFSVTLENDTVLVGGGTDSRYSILHDPAAGTWQLTGPMNEQRFGATATLLRSGQVLVVGGASSQDISASAELFDPVSVSWTPVSPNAVPRVFHTATELWDGSLLVTGGYTFVGNDYQPTPSVERLAKPQVPPRRAAGRR